MDKDALKKILMAISSPEEKEKLTDLDLQKEFKDKLEFFGTTNSEKLKQIETNLLTLQKAILSSKETNNVFIETYQETSNSFVKSLLKLNNTIPLSVIKEFKKLPEYQRLFGPVITVSKEPPSNPKIHDLWVNLS